MSRFLTLLNGGGTVASFSPSMVPNLRMWLNAADSNTITIGTGVSQWSDKSGNGFHVTQATGSAQPVYSATGGVNGKPALVFDGVDDWLRITSSPITDSEDFTIFYVGTGNFTRGLDTFSGWSVRGGGSGSGKAVVLVATGASQYVANTPASGNSNFVCMTLDQNSPTNSTLTAYYENVGSTPNVASNYTLRTSTTGITLGISSSGAAFVSGTTSALLVYNRILTATERQNVMSWLIARYS